jgi:hypothetical protein
VCARCRCVLVLCFALECSSAFRARGTPRRVARESERAIRFQIVVLSCMLANEISPMRTANPDARAAPNGQDAPGHLLHFPPPDDSRAHRTITSLAVTLILTLFASLDSSWYDSTSTPRWSILSSWAAVRALSASAAPSPAPAPGRPAAAVRVPDYARYTLQREARHRRAAAPRHPRQHG